VSVLDNGSPITQTMEDATADRRKELIAAAMRLFSERPYEDVSVDELASEAGVAKGLLYYYFGNKRGLYATGLEHMAADMRKQMLLATSVADLSPMERLDRAFDAHLAYVEQRAAGYRALLASVGAHPQVGAILKCERTFHRELIEAGLPSEVSKGAAVTAAVEGWLHFVDGAVFAWLEQQTMTREQVRELCTGTLVGALAAAGRVDRVSLSAS
jgi:AcrR family transcriptional regulator